MVTNTSLEIDRTIYADDVKTKNKRLLLLISSSLILIVMMISMFNRPSIVSTYSRPWLDITDEAGAIDALDDEVLENHYAVATEHVTCTNIASNILEQGGSAVEAGIAAAFCIGTVNSFSSGIGGGGMAMVRDIDGEIYAYDFREVAPEAAFKDMFKNDPSASLKGGLSVAVPGELKGFWDIYQKFALLGLEWNQLITPSIELARNGFVVDRELARRIQIYKDDIMNEPTLREVFAPNGVLLELGDTMYRKNYADTLEAISENGPAIFYSGKVGQSVVDFVQERGGVLTMEDLKKYKSIQREVVNGTFKGSQIYSIGAPGSGNLIITLLNILEGYGDEEPEPAVYVQRIVESLKFVYGIRSTLGDPMFNKTIYDFVKQSVNKTFADSMRKRIHDDETFDPEYYSSAKIEGIDDHGTTHISIIDKDGISFSLTSTINHIFGSKLIDPQTGIMLNNEMDDFSQPGRSNAFGFVPNPNNYIEPLKRPQSSMAPIIIEREGQPWIVTGGSGGSYIISAVIQVLLNIMTRRMLPQQAIEEPRLHHQLIPNILHAESLYEPSILETLRSFGHDILFEGPNSAVQIAAKLSPKGGYVAGADTRKHGYAIAK